MNWMIQKSDFFQSRFRRFQKKHPDEAKAVLDNLDYYLTALNECNSPINVKAGFIHDEPDGIKAIDQKGGKGRLMQSRLYIFPEENTRILHIISIGTKVDQCGDINDCRKFVKSLRNRS